jgi:hypothetical protein
MLSVAAGLAVVPTAAFAQEERIETPYRWIERGTRLGLFGGYILADRGEPPLGPGSGPLIGARLRARLSSPLSLEISLGYLSSDQRVMDPRLEGGPAVVDTVNADMLIIAASVQLALTGARSYRRIQPYIVIGGGILQELSTETSDALAGPREPFEYTVGTTAMLQLGIGTEIDLSERFGLALEVRDDLWRLTTPDGWFLPGVLQNIIDSGAPAPEASQWAHNFELTAGLYYYF